MSIVRFPVPPSFVKSKSFSNKRSEASFTLIELLVVIAILALLMSVIIITLNPSEMMRKSRDVKRISQLASLSDSIAMFQVSKPNTSLGTASTVYVSVPDSSATCANLSLPPLPSGYSYSCSTSANYRNTNGTGWLPINFNALDTGSPITTLPIDPTNATSTGLYYTFATDSSNTYELSSIMESDKYIQESSPKDGGDSDNGFEKGSNLTLTPLIFPNNWIYTPDNFWVMKYEAKYSKTGAGKGDNAGSCYYDVSYDTWDYAKTGTDCPSSWSTTNFVSSANGSPVAGISHTDAKTVCAALGARLIYNSEWMQIARNAEQVASNWSSGTVGTGCLFRGNNGTADSCGYNGDNPEKGDSRNAKAKFTLSNNKEIWDIAGNLWEHVQNTSADTLIQYTPSDGGAVGWTYKEFTALTSYGDLSYDTIRPSNAGYDSTYGVGKVYTYNGDYGSAIRALVRGGYWGSGAVAGSFALGFGWVASTQDSSGSFRCSR